MKPLVRKVDHVYVPVEDPEPMFSLFTETLGLPAAWPIHDYGVFRSGGVAFGNCNVEFVTGPREVLMFEPVLPTVVRGIALEPDPDCDDWAASLDERELRHTHPLPHEGTGCHGFEGHLWTSMGVGGLVAHAATVFLSEYHSNESLRGAEARAALDAAGGGAIGVEAVTEITIGVQDTAKTSDRWQRLLDPLEPSEPGRWELGDGPAIHVRESPIDGVAGITVRVRSLAEARTALMERRLLGPVRRHGMGLHYARTHGLDIWLTE